MVSIYSTEGHEEDAPMVPFSCLFKGINASQIDRNLWSSSRHARDSEGRFLKLIHLVLAVAQLFQGTGQLTLVRGTGFCAADGFVEAGCYMRCQQ